MIAEPKRPLNYKLRVLSGELEGQWLFSMNVSKSGTPFQVTNWNGVEQHASQYVFHPQFVSDESGAFRPVNHEAAERFQRILKGLGIETEIIVTDPK